MKTKNDGQTSKKEQIEKGLKPMFSNTSMPSVKAPKEPNNSSKDTHPVENKEDIKNDESE